MQLTLAQVAKFFSVSENTISLWVRQRNLPVQEVNSRYRFIRSELLEWATTSGTPFSPSFFAAVNGDHIDEIRLADSLERGGLLPCVAGTTRSEALEHAIAGLPLPKSFDRESLLRLLLVRENVGGTAISGGIAIPHPRYPVVLPEVGTLVRACYLQHPLDYRAADGRFVDTLFLMICPTVHAHLQVLAKLACVVHSRGFREVLDSRPDQAQLIAAVSAVEATFVEDASDSRPQSA